MKSWAERRIEVQRERAQWKLLEAWFQALNPWAQVVGLAAVGLLLARLVLS